MDVRFLVEAHMTGLAAVHRTPNEIAAMQSSINRFRDNSDDYKVCLEEDLRFHTLVAEACGNPVMAMFMNPINECLRETYTLEDPYMSRTDATLREHQAILDAISLQDHDLAVRTAEAHLRRIDDSSSGLVPGPTKTLQTKRTQPALM
jgi:DNA-binding FadR family transcriptional regulator